MKRAELRNVNKTFETVLDATGRTKSVTALDNVSLSFLPGEIHAILGGKRARANRRSCIFSPGLTGRRAAASSWTGTKSASTRRRRRSPTASRWFTSGRSSRKTQQRSITFFSACRESLSVAEGEAREISALAQRWGIDVNLAAKVNTLDARDRLMTALLSALYREPDFLSSSTNRRPSFPRTNATVSSARSKRRVRTDSASYSSPIGSTKHYASRTACRFSGKVISRFPRPSSTRKTAHP